MVIPEPELVGLSGLDLLEHTRDGSADAVGIGVIDVKPAIPAAATAACLNLGDTVLVETGRSPVAKGTRLPTAITDDIDPRWHGGH